MTPQPPPVPCRADGRLRRVGVEIEFAGMPPRATANLVQSLFGGRLEVISAHRLKVTGARWGDFGIELDTQYAHPDSRLIDPDAYQDNEWERMRQDFHTRTRELIGDVVTGLVPTEIVCPPVPWDELDELDALFEGLRHHGAKGTDASLLYGFGLHLNPEMPSLAVEDILAYLRAYLLTAKWLREQIRVDITREMLPHANPFPRAYAIKVLDPDYTPDLETLIDDYLEDNPTRNRELDLLPLFAYLHPEHPHALLTNALVKPRPTLHYRLPNAQLSEPGWGAVTEWNRWLEVEVLATSPATLAERGAQYLALHRPSLARRWWTALRRWSRRP
ncbi:amidoligase family protein [Halomonas maura]|uniref:amidoligase family protein n=1 Tax=Halomonas maura TaxID=117606 RepID=UPI0025B5DB46|nr:amidoligase family protein [Halomonas maura]MDN3556495.1 amidoligase family protein [Halomonas maura]